MASSASESVLEGIEFFSEANSLLLRSLMEETQEEHDQYYGDDRLVSMIQSLEAEISGSLLGYTASELQGFDNGHADGQDCSTSVSDHDCGWVDDMEVSSSSQFEEMNTWSSYYGDEMDDIAMEYEFGNYINGNDHYHFCYLPQEPSDAVCSS
ncbi:hypothetical protein L6164_018228 [Bauhinia variegata]|uniref:Uncharacterized protein n=1 Tax=Bauhinia variegata TaxID=167791 RepID=A0ACB9NBJ6_BAUVA|nr:hypothetical protein L6164_018228 [Bauhinia variegata]